MNIVLIVVIAWLGAALFFYGGFRLGRAIGIAIGSSIPIDDNGDTNKR